MGQRVTEGRSCALHSQPAAGWPTAARCRAAVNSPPLLLCACAALSRQWRERSRPIPRPQLTAHAVECGLGSEPGATPREHGHDRDRERQAHAITVTAHDHGRGSRLCDPCLNPERKVLWSLRFGYPMSETRGVWEIKEISKSASTSRQVHALLAVGWLIPPDRGD